MEKTIQAVYENGILYPLQPLELAERQQVTLTISDRTDVSSTHPLLVCSDEWAHAAHDDVSLEEVRRALSAIHGSLSQAVLEERRER